VRTICLELSWVGVSVKPMTPSSNYTIQYSKQQFTVIFVQTDMFTVSSHTVPSWPPNWLCSS